MPDIVMTPGNKAPGRYKKTTLSVAMVALIASGAPAIGLFQQFLYEREGSRLTAYPDGEGIWTICTGLTRYKGKPVTKGMQLSPSECKAADAIELEATLRAAEGVMGKAMWATMSEPAKVAIADMVYNIGLERTRNSTAVRELKAGRINEGCAAITLWIRDRDRDCRKQGSNCQGQPIRRMQADEMCLIGDAP